MMVQYAFINEIARENLYAVDGPFHVDEIKLCTEWKPFIIQSRNCRELMEV